MPRARMVRHRRRHDADRAGAGDQHVLAQHGKRERGMHGIAEGIENAGDIGIDRMLVHPDIRHRQRDVFRERARTIHAHAAGARAEMTPSREAVPAASADHMPFAADQLAGEEVEHVRPHRDDLAHEFMADHHGDRNGALRPIVPFEDVDVGAADRGFLHADQDIVDSNLGDRHLFQPKSRFRSAFHQRFHKFICTVGRAILHLQPTFQVACD